MRLHLDLGVSQKPKHGEELCGDSVYVSKTAGSTIVILSDGLGSGVKANILSRLTATMAGKMLEKGGRLDDVIEALAETLPVCKVRHLAYSTFTILQVSQDGRVYLAEYDNPTTYLGGKSGLKTVDRIQREIGGRVIHEAYFDADDGDWMVLASDGVLHAGVGGIWDLGWGWDRVGAYIEKMARHGDPAQDQADELLDLVNKLYAGSPGDDASVAVVQVRRPRRLAVLIGPPERRERDDEVVRVLTESAGRKVVCGGTTGNMVARVLGRRIDVDLASPSDEVPPVGLMEGVDLVTEGMLTMAKCLDNMRRDAPARRFAGRRDGASLLTTELLQADEIEFLVGRAINPAHQSPDIPSSLALKQQMVEQVTAELRRRGRLVRTRYF
ncbi:MAG TPA: SpoIIE family protein phosphatase [Bacillota bacterium]|jgi:hypothetical protein